MIARTSVMLAVAAVLCLAAGIGGRSAAAERERILDFESDITVYADGGMTVTETITVVAARDRIKRGIYRDFPTTYTDSHGNTLRVGFAVVKVLRDDAPEPFHMEGMRNGERVYIGNENIFLTPGEYILTPSPTRPTGSSDILRTPTSFTGTSPETAGYLRLSALRR